MRWESWLSLSGLTGNAFIPRRLAAEPPLRNPASIGLGGGDLEIRLWALGTWSLDLAHCRLTLKL